MGQAGRVWIALRRAASGPSAGLAGSRGFAVVSGLRGTVTHSAMTDLLARSGGHTNRVPDLLLLASQRRGGAG
jgi:hypothetical protein